MNWKRGSSMKKFIILLLFCLSLPTVVFAQNKIPILVYHSIDVFQGHGMKELYVTPENFEKQMEYLKNNGYTLLTFERWQERNKVPKPIFITFDDGYKNNLHVFSIFRKLKSAQFHPSATLFVISDFIGRPNRLTSSDLKMMSDSGMFSVQSHTATHPDLTKITDYEYQLKSSKEKIAQITGKPVNALAYPMGVFNEKVVQETQKYYRFGLTTTPELFVEKGTKNELLLLPRLYVKYSTTLEDFANIIKGH